MKHPSITFQEQNYVKIENFIDKSLANHLYEYVKMNAQVSADMVYEYGDKIWKNEPNLIGVWNDPQAPGCYSKYGDPAFDVLLKTKHKDLESILNLKLVPTYTYHRLYVDGAELKKHKDRPSCEISYTMCLGYDANYNWPMFIEGKPIELNPGDMVVYRGCEVEHWREQFKGLNHAQVFVHYNEDDGTQPNLNDGRTHLGLPSEFKKYD